MLLRLCGNLRGKTERVASRVEEDSPSVRRWLDWRAASSQLLSLLNRGLQICHREIEVDLLGDIARRPCRRLVVRDLHRAQPHPVRAMSTVVAVVNMISPPGIAAQNSASLTGSAQSNETKPLRATAMD